MTANRNSDSVTAMMIAKCASKPGQHDGGDNNDLGDQRCDHEDEVEQ